MNPIQEYQPPTQAPKPKSRFLRRAFLTSLVAAVGVGIYWLISSYSSKSANDTGDIPTAIVRRMNLRDKVLEQGEIASQSTITGTCEVDDHENKIIFLAPEGSQVKKGQVVCKFDSSKFEEYVSEREARVNEERAEVETAEQQLLVQKDENESALRAAVQAVEFAKLDLDKYVKGDYVVQTSDLKGSISEGETSVEKARRGLENMRTLVKRGFREYEQLREAEQVLKSADLRLTRDKQKLDTLEKFEHVKQLAEFEGRYEESKHKLIIAKTTAKAKLAQAEDTLKNEKQGLKIYERRLREAKENLAKHAVKAPQDGTLVYARDDWRGNGEKLHEGKTVYQNQPIFVLPDMNKMQVKVGVHESMVGKIKPNQPALVRVESFSAQTLRGKVKTVALLSDSTRWEPSNNYSVIVTINEFPESMKLKPGMTAEVEILVGEYADVLAVPIQAVASFGRKKFAFVQISGGEFEPQEVTIGKSNISFVAIESGLEEDSVVALDAYQRALVNFGEEEPEEEDETDALVAELPAEGETEVGKTTGESESDLPPLPPLLDADGKKIEKADEGQEKGKEEAVKEEPSKNETASGSDDSESKPESKPEPKADEKPAEVAEQLEAAPAEPPKSLQLQAPAIK